MDNVDSASRQFNLPKWSAGDPVSARKLNAMSDAIASANRGTPIASQGGASQNVPKECRVVVTSASQSLSGLPTIDGVVLISGDYVLRATSNADNLDGVYIAFSGTWQRIARLNYAINDNTVVLPHGTVISIWDGSTSPSLWVASVSGAVTFA